MSTFPTCCPYHRSGGTPGQSCGGDLHTDAARAIGPLDYNPATGCVAECGIIVNNDRSGGTRQHIMGWQAPAYVHLSSEERNLRGRLFAASPDLFAALTDIAFTVQAEQRVAEETLRRAFAAIDFARTGERS